MHCLKCELCQLTFVGKTNLKNHIENAYKQHSQPSVPDPAVGSLGDYLASLENKVEHCTTLILKQSAVLGKLLALKEIRQAKNNISAQPSPRTIQVIDIENDLTTRHHLRCDQCSFETDNRSQLNLRISGRHIYHTSKNQSSLVSCPMCSYNNTSEEEVQNHIEKKHPETISSIQCPMSNYSNSSGTEVTKHIEDKHPESSTQNENANPFHCPLCSYKNSSESKTP